MVDAIDARLGLKCFHMLGVGDAAALKWFQLVGQKTRPEFFIAAVVLKGHHLSHDKFFGQSIVTSVLIFQNGAFVLSSILCRDVNHHVIVVLLNIR